MNCEYRMYCLAERHLSPIQKAIQSAHAIVEYGQAHGDTEAYKQWAKFNKTIVILDGGNTIDLNGAIVSLDMARIPYAIFEEPDMNYFETAICFLANDQVFDYEQYGRSYEHYMLMCDKNTELPKLPYEEWVRFVGGNDNVILKSIISDKKLAV